MSTQFECRLLRGSMYQSAVRQLERIESGEVGALDEFRERCLQLLAGGSFREWHSALDLYLYHAWQEQLRSLSPAKFDMEQVAEFLIALSAMPDFQLSYYYGEKRSPNLVVLGEDDGGLYGVLCDADPWFDDLFLKRFSDSCVRFAVGRAMIVLGRDDVARLESVVTNVQEELLSRARSPEACRQTRGRFLLLIENCLKQPDGELAVSEAG